MGNCGKCKHWHRNKYPKAERDEFQSCGNPKMDEDKSEFIRAGGYEGYGDYFVTSAKFGCILFEENIII